MPVLLVALAALGAGWARWRPFRVEVRGWSMAPALADGDWALAVRGGPRRGAVVVLEDPRRPGVELVKRVVAGPGDVAPDGQVLGPDAWWVEGDGAGSTDSRDFGPVAGAAVRGRVVLVWWPRLRGPGGRDHSR